MEKGRLTMVELTEYDKRLLTTYAKCNMNIAATARKLYMHRNTAVYNLERIKRETGLDPTSFFELVQLLEVRNMTANRYQDLALRTVNRTLGEESLLMDGMLGLCGEAGECADIVKKAMFQGHQLDKRHLARELGDVAWYLAVSAHAIGEPLGNIFGENIEKLMRRYPEGFDEARSKIRSNDDT